MLLLWLTSNQYAINILTFLTTERTLQPEGLLHSRGMAASGFPPLRNIPHCCLSVPVWLAILSDQLEIVGLVGLYPTNYLISLGFIPWQVVSHPFHLSILCGISHRFQWLSPSKSQIPKPYSPVRHSSALKASFQPVTVRLACVKPAASVQSEP